MNQDHYRALMVLLTQCALGGYMMWQTDFRQPTRRWRMRWLAMIGALATLHVAVIWWGYFDLYTRLAVFTLVIPYTVATVWCSRYRGLRALFGVANGFFLGCIGGVNGYLAQALAPSLLWLPILVRLISIGLFSIVLLKLNVAYQSMLRQMDKGWMTLSLIPIFTCLVILYANREFFSDAPFQTAIILYGLVLVCGCAYFLIYLFFEQVQKGIEARNSQMLLQTQVAAMQVQIKAIHEAEELVRQERHNLRHRLQTVTELVARGDRQAAMDVIHAAQTRLEEHRLVHWCRQPVLDAMFFSYFEQAKRQGIQVNARIALPEGLTVDEMELAIALSNALENAIQANLALPREQRALYCKVIGYPRLMFRITNPFVGHVRFDEQGLPVASQEGHGLGVRSIAAFCEKNHALCTYQAQDNRFTLQVIL